MTSEKIDPPDLSIVAVSRNDDHGGNLLQRMQLFISGILDQCKRHRLKAELLLVEWNPPSSRPELADALNWPNSNGFCPVRIIQVPAEIHARFKHSDRLQLFQMIGKNAGIRRSNGVFILATNVDILFSEELMEFLASGQLRPGRVYRIDRCDVPANVLHFSSIQDQLAYCENNIIRVHTRDGTIIPSDVPLQTKATEKKSLRYYMTTPLKPMHILAPIQLGYYSLRRGYRRFRELVLPHIKFHTNSCGDFTLMEREHWMSVRGYAEFEMYSMHIDSLLCYAALYSGIQENLLTQPMCIYHIEHDLGSGWQPGQGGEMLYQRLREAGVPILTFKQVGRWADRMWLKGSPTLFNKNEDWGLADQDLPETLIL